MIYTVTLNPAIDHIIHVKDELTRGKNNHVLESYNDIGGKGTHVSVVLSCLETQNKATGFIGEQGKNELYALLRERKVIPDFFVLPNRSVRQNYVLMDETHAGSFMITHTGPTITSEEIKLFTADLVSKLAPDDLVVFAGNPSKLINANVYRSILERVKETGAQLIIDASGEYLKEAIKVTPTLIKPNQFEFAELTKKTITSIDDTIGAMENSNLPNIDYIIVSLGKEGSLLFHNNSIYRVTPPKVNTVNDTGCGDAFVGGIVYALYKKFAVKDMLTFATSVSASKAMQPTSSGFVPSEASLLREQVAFEKIK
ncbi:1-phosphofructokinase family hexose kinase [Sporolactobacillus shoreicorticis]|uniref:Tagatose-6-phosphate kinase n=1 Tax=Sporolactobacillus shoreicorticis TaxID=1923877 RepID=A0ABW5S508_9BACL|nr:1-phosphofructokinase family hexose kinase [Sporolactobacillus shoreicorticis]MCO7128350.1 1-phosphofructokinase family hexose kinase [Sporolactobacillus shoreicorticis]